MVAQLTAVNGEGPPLDLPLRFKRLDRWLLGCLGRSRSEKATCLVDVYPPCEVLQSESTSDRFPHLQLAAFAENDGARASLGPQHIVRCMNVMTALTPLRRSALLAWIEATLLPSGHAVIGVHDAAGSESRYRIFVRSEKELAPVAFAFSIDCLFPLGPRSMLELERDADAGRLTRYVRLVRQDRKFARAFDARFDHLLLNHGLLAKTPRCSAILAHPLTLTARAEALDQILCRLDEEGWVDRASSILARAGVPAFRNECCDIAVRLGD